MEVKIIEAKNNEIRLVEDILLIYVKDINLLRNMNKEQLVEFMFNENEIVKSLSFVREFKDSIRNCVFDIISVNELRDLIESKEVPLYSLIISTATYYKKIYLASKRNAIDEVSIECSKENFVNVISLVNNETRNVTIKCHDISLKEYSELLKDINVSNKNVKVDYQEANTPIKLNTLHDLSLFIGNIVSYINKYNLSELEKIMYVYDIVKYRIYNKDEDNYLNNRDLDKVTSGNTIVCSGFSNLFNAILMSLDIKAMPLISKTAKHQRSIVYVNDSKYDIDGIYVFDPTWDCRKKESENYYLERYNYFMMPLSRSKITAYDEISRLLEVNVKDIIKKIYLSALTEKREMLLRDNIKKEITYNVALLEEQIRQDLKGTERSVLESVTMAVWRTRIEKEKILTAFQLLEIILCYGNQKDYGVYDGEYVKESILRELFAIAQNKIEVFEDKQLVNEYRKLNRTNKILMEQSGIMQCLQELPKEWQQDYAVRSERNKSGWLLTGILSGVFVLAGIAAEVLFFIFYNHININIAVLTGILLSAAGIVGAIVVLICMLISLNR